MTSTFYQGQQEGVPKYLEDSDIDAGFRHNKYRIKVSEQVFKRK